MVDLGEGHRGQEMTEEKKASRASKSFVDVSENQDLMCKHLAIFMCKNNDKSKWHTRTPPPTVWC